MNPEPDTQELSRLEEVLRRPDFLLEPSCFSVICAYIKAGGTPNAIIENLTDGYVGYAHMASLMCGWMDALDNDLEGDGPSSVQPQASTHGAQQGMEGCGRQERNEFGFLKEFVRARFDPDKLSSVFMKRAGGKPPAWLDQLTSTPQGRALIYQLSAAHRNCLVLNFAIQKILVQAVSVHSLQQLSRELVDSCAHAGHTYLHAQQLLGAAAEHPRGGPVFERLSQDLQAATTALYPAAWGTMVGVQNRVGAQNRVGMQIRVGVQNRVGADQGTSRHQTQHMQGNGWEPAASIQESHGHKRTREAGEGEGEGEEEDRTRKQARSGSEGGGGAGGVAGLKSIDDLFEDEEEEEEGIGRGDGHDQHHHHHPQHQHEQPHQHGHNGGGAGWGLDGKGGQEGNARQWEGLEGMRGSGAIEGRGHAGCGGAEGAQQHHQQLRCRTEAERLEETQSALRCVLAVGAKAGARGLSREDVGSVQQLVSVPVAGVALLHHIRCLLGARDYYGESGAPAVADYLRLALLVARSQPQLVQEVVDLLQCALQSMGSQRAEVAHACLGAMVHLMRDCHAVEQVMAAVDVWAKEADPSLVRHFAIQVLVSLAPPYSPTFAHWLLRHIVRSGLRRGRDMHQGTRNALLLQVRLHALACMC
ncbi:TH1 protein-domain-containing protein [Dunaliella salina]|uniref:TH1 protein-domain-containing protein n=1 Tax=Dunaliella salina TaxID=3046 RepID=A0ABQ7GYS4_DUNSA|nr:TH1 protein-domain-containing protein [Dunaliella salina]|eukprot:KAF5839747.1 TH1 protein-domain-containing protein [Dunaliella salina]